MFSSSLDVAQREDDDVRLKLVMPELVTSHQAADAPLVTPDDFLRINKLLKLAGLPPGRRNQTQRIRRSHLSYWQASGGDAAARANHSSPSVTWKHYLDRSMLPQDDVEKRIPRIV